MKLVDKFTLWFIGIIVLTTPVTAYICYHNLVKNIDKTEISQLSALNETTASRMEKGLPIGEAPKGSSLSVTPLQTALPEDRVQIEKTNSDDKGFISLLTVNSYYTIKGQPYRISSNNYIPGSKQIMNAIMDTIIWKLLIIIVCVSITARLVSARILQSLKLTIKQIQRFNVKKKVQFPVTRTHEFRELNEFLQRTTDKAVDEYVAIKEFSENASHELQTPLAILRNKLELLSETNIEEDQATLLGDMQNAIERLSKIHRSLTLIAKLENNEYAVSESIKFCRIAKDVLAAYEDRIEMKHLSVHTDFGSNVQLKIHPMLADMLMNNLLGNAVRHNVDNGNIDIRLTAQRLIVSNTGLPPEMPTDELFQRFKKSNQCSDSVGLGLSIVKQICDVSGFCVSYSYKNRIHTLQVDFQPAPKAVVTPVPLDNLAAAAQPAIV
ncbi:HAMP domain-containing histidine kinase [Chitinophaga agrisoli]|uniref:histidine kinase n=1 Tax=Chitinophaga agrisoli TaxID=2607653 RepID=A0A5B2VWK7_9BACT|nr:HAMP domain-containing sensor histidine kinase [Chitinophaga agrisoli]KAA2242988.1 HAMP domain-containing histidine kinase [Chitinophaga agrisoli]